jgi:hypothetical protein
MVGGAVWNNHTTGTFDVQTDAGFGGDFFEPTATFNNAGTFVKSTNTGTANAKLFFNNSGLVDVAAGTLSLNGAGVDTGAFYVEAGATLKFLIGQGTQGDASFWHGPTSSIAGPGDVVFGASDSFGTYVARHIVGGYYGVTGNTTVSAGMLEFAADVSLATLYLTGGGLTGPGTIFVTGAFTWTGGTLQGGHLVSSGTMMIGNSPTGRVMDSYVLDNAGTAAWTGGNINVVATTWNNLPGSTLDAQGDAVFTSGFVYSNSWFNNQGTFLKSAGTGTTQFRVFFNNDGYTEVASGNLDVAGGGLSGGAFAVDAGAKLTFDGNAVALGPTDSIYGDGDVALATDFTLDGAYYINGTTTVSTGTVVLDGGGAFNNLALSGGTLTGAGDFYVGGMLTWTGGTMSGGATTYALGGLTISGNNTKQLDGRALVNAGAGTWSGTGNLPFFNGASFDNPATGTFDIQNDATLGTFGSVFTNEGVLKKSAAAGTTSLFAELTNTGTLQVNSGTLSLGGDLENDGDLSVASGATLRVDGVVTQYAGTLTLAGGTLTLTPNNLLDLEGGVLSGTGTINTNVLNAARVSPGGDGAAGALTINGSYTQTVTGVLTIDLGGLTAGTQYDQLRVNGAARLDGTLQVNLIGGFTPALNDSFQVVTSTSESGDFAVKNLAPLSGELHFDTSASSTGYTLVVH